jgi:ubiquinone/menaquinone biosynthesis C-methylase UbiE
MIKKVILEHVKCDYCSQEKYITRYRKPDNWLNKLQYEFPIVECINCGLVYLNPRPTQDSMSLFYPENYHEDRNTESFKKRYAAQCEYIPGLNEQKVLDIGCARGDFLSFLKGLYPNIKTFGVDFFSEKVNYDFIKFHKKNLKEADFPNSFFDIVTAWAVFEHLHEPNENFEEVNRILKSGGKFIFLVTNSESFYGKYAYVEDIPRHTYHFSEKTLNNYAEKCGFKATRYYYETRFWNPTGYGTFYYKFMEFFGSTWEKRLLNRDFKFQRFAGSIGKKIDKIIFSKNWEAKIGRSGILIAEFTK